MVIRQSLTIVVLVVAAMCQVASVSARSPWTSLEDGDRLRLIAMDQRILEGRFRPTAGDSILLSGVAGNESVPFANIDGLWVEQSNAARGFLWGAVGGGLIGLGVLLGLQQALGGSTETGDVVLFMGAGASGGALIGTVIGASVPKWDPVSLPAQ